MATNYEILGLHAGADSGQVRAAFHALAKRSHPDINVGDISAEKRFKDINAAYEVLSNPERRAAYDLGLKHKHAETRWRVCKVMATTAAAFMTTVGFGLYCLPSAPSAHELRTAIVATVVSSPSPTDTQVQPEQTTRFVVERTRQNASRAAPPADAPGRKVSDRTSPRLDPQAQRAQALHLYEKGMEQIEQGNVLAARSFFALAAKAGLERSIRALAGTYDPVQLDKLKVLGVQPDVDAARSWYEKAGDLAATTNRRIPKEWDMVTVEKPLSKLTTGFAADTSRD